MFDLDREAIEAIRRRLELLRKAEQDIKEEAALLEEVLEELGER